MHLFDDLPVASTASSAAEIVSRLAKAMSYKRPSASCRMVAEQPVSAAEGRRMAEIYFNIKDSEIRQALLDVMVSIGETEAMPHGAFTAR